MHATRCEYISFTRSTVVGRSMLLFYRFQIIVGQFTRLMAFRLSGGPCQYFNICRKLNVRDFSRTAFYLKNVAGKYKVCNFELNAFNNSTHQRCLGKYFSCRFNRVSIQTWSLDLLSVLWSDTAYNFQNFCQISGNVWAQANADVWNGAETASYWGPKGMVDVAYSKFGRI